MPKTATLHCKIRSDWSWVTVRSGAQIQILDPTSCPSSIRLSSTTVKNERVCTYMVRTISILLYCTYVTAVRHMFVCLSVCLSIARKSFLQHRKQPTTTSPNNNHSIILRLSTPNQLSLRSTVSYGTVITVARSVCVVVVVGGEREREREGAEKGLTYFFGNFPFFCSLAFFCRRLAWLWWYRFGFFFYDRWWWWCLL